MSFLNSTQVSNDGWFNNVRGDYIPINSTTPLLDLGGFLFVAWVEQETTGNPRIYAGKYDKSTNTLVESVFVHEAPQPDEPHGHPVVGYNSNNEIFVFTAGFGGFQGPINVTPEPIRVSKSATPLSLDFGTATDIPQGLVNSGMLYLRFRYFPDGTMRIYGRDTDHYYIQSDDGGSTWNTAVEVIRNTRPGIASARIYNWSSVDPTNPNIIHHNYCNSDSQGIDYDLYYFYEDFSTDTYYDVEGNVLTLPITHTSTALIESAPSRHPNGYGPYIDNTGAPVILYTADFVGSYINLKRWNGTTWDTHVVESGGGASQYICRGIFWEVGNTKHLLLHKRNDGNNSVSNIIEYTSTDWDNWTATGNAIADNIGDYRGISFLGQNQTTWPEYGLIADQSNGNVFLYNAVAEGDISGTPIQSTANIRFNTIANGSHPVKIYDDTTNVVLFNGNLTFTNKTASTTVNVPSGTVILTDWLGSNPPATGSTNYSTTV